MKSKNKKSSATSPKIKKRHLRRFSKDIIKPHLFVIVVAMIFMAIFAAANAGTAWLIKPIINNMLVLKDMTDVYKIALAVIFLSLGKGISQYIYSSLLSGVSIKVIAVARYNLVKSFLRQDLVFFHQNPPGKLLSIINNDVNAMRNLATTIPINIGRDFLTFVGLVVVMFVQQPLYSLVIIFAIFFIIVPIKIVNKKLKKYFASTNLGMAELNSRSEQIFSGIKEVKSYNMEIDELKTTKTTLDAVSNVEQKIRKASMLLPAVMELFAGISVGAILIYGGYAIINNEADPGTFFSFIAALLLAYQPLKRLSEVTTTVQLGLLGVGRYYEFLDIKPKILSDNTSKVAKFDQAVLEFKNVSFGYEEGNTAIDDISFIAKPGETVALVGRSGGGKSTIVNLIERFYDPTNGEVTINGENIKSFSVASLRRNIAYVGQDLTLFDDTVSNNIAYGSDNVTDEQIREAANKAHCTDFIKDLPKGMDTIIGARGVRLSGGQKQRIAIARAILKNAPILLLDEATSALDSESEQSIQQALEYLTKNKTTIAIAHRLSTIIGSNKILVINKGKVIEEGSHDMLIEKDGFYKFLYNLQAMEMEKNER